MKQFIALLRRGNSVLRRNLLLGLLLVLFGLVGCGGKLGEIEPSAVDTAIADAEAAIAAAREVDAPSLAADAFAGAASNLEAAKTALAEKKGGEALRLAYQAISDARISQRNALYIAKNAELNAALLQKAAGADKLRQTLGAKEQELAEVRTEIQVLRRDETSGNRPLTDFKKRTMN